MLKVISLAALKQLSIKLFYRCRKQQKTFVENQNNSTYSLYAVKTFVEAPLLGGKITIGNDLLILTIIRITKCIIKI